MSSKKSIQRNDFHRVRVQEQLRQLENSVINIASGKDLSFSRVHRQSHFVPDLSVICAEELARSFEKLTAVDALAVENPKLYEMVIERLSTDLPLDVVVARVDCDKYWRRCCEARWSYGQLCEQSNGKLVICERSSWKQFFLERALRDFLMGLSSPHPSDVESQQLEKLCHTTKEYVYSVDLPCQVTHLDLYNDVLLHMPHVEHLRLTYGVSNVGTNFEWGMIGFTEEDALGMRYVLKKYMPLRSIRLPNNRLNSSLLKGILSGLVSNTSIRVLDFSSNSIDDDGAKSLALLLCKQDLPLEELYLHDNRIRGEGAVAIGEALTINRTLRVLNLRLNRIPDKAGGVELVKSLESHKALEVLDVSHNLLGDDTAQVLAEVLPSQLTLLSLNISGNRALGVGAGKALLEGLRKNERLRFFDARSCGLSAEHLSEMEGHVRDVVQSSKMKKIETMEQKRLEMIRKQVEENLMKVISVQ
ncbi:hypothetical protein TRVL_03297 [Trypanosoma vivax]|nr:hypothetical protein TRVL_03297 [Trypanosoma vivax]